MTSYDAIVVGSGPNGLAAAIVLAQAGLSVLVREANSTLGGGARTLELTLPGFHHDIGSAVHPMAAASPFFQTLPLADHGLHWIQPPLPLVHPLDGAPPAILERSIEATGASLGPDADAYRRLIEPLVREWNRLVPEILSPPIHIPQHPFAMAQYGLRALLPGATLNSLAFVGDRAKALFAGLACHSIVPLESMASSAIGLVMAMSGHAAGWPIPQGGSQQITNALASYLRSLGGTIETDAPVHTTDELPAARALLFDLTPRQVARIAVKRLPAGYIQSLNRFSYGPGVFKIDWALSEPVPWTYAACSRTATLHLGGTAEEIMAGERDSWNGRTPTRPFVLFAQQSLFDPTRAPEGKHTGWAYCHVPNGSTADMTSAIEDQVERFAPGFRDTILARSTKNTAQMELSNANLIGGDIGGGANNLMQLLIRPTLSLDPYRTPGEGVYLCSSSTPPGGGVHGMCGYHAARSALKHTFGIA
ncbi:NAD(P)/FAD-dependent oxidoreductase [Granulicella sp. WH15]|uniref:phytoene desaturase family protein n=1 Tax=Granulicella sp. WH15 TaxID=2602070 RepID=UPI0013675141|nr:NAD(P)/FAD-dependent oxidoreductase [Granulicella sp. WH15]QHN04901.1 NAD(P)/FAD-dependent oxidoreductase [Granulicella sp. WH15]